MIFPLFLDIRMITLNVEIRYAQNFEGATSVTKISKEEFVVDVSEVLHEVITSQMPEIAQEPFTVLPTDDFTNLPDSLYLVEEPGIEGIRTFIKSDGKIEVPSGRFYTFHVIFGFNVHAPKMTLEIQDF